MFSSELVVEHAVDDAVDGLAAVNMQGLADYVLRALHVRKEQNGRDDVLGLAEEAYGYLSLEALDVSFGVSVGKLCLYKARRDAAFRLSAIWLSQ